MVALAALLEVADAATAAPATPSLQLKALLTLLFRRSNGDRSPYADFWATMIEEAGGHPSEYARGTYARTHWARIVRTLGGRPERMGFDASVRAIAKQHAADHSLEAMRRRRRGGG